MKRIAAFMLLLCFVAAALLPDALVLAHAGHGHDGHSCAVCLQFQGARDLLKRFDITGGGIPYIFMGIIAVITAIYAAPPVWLRTLVCLKIRLNA